LGVTAVEVMPVADFPGHFGWGYDGVNLFAPTRLYGRPDDFRRFVDLAHAAGLGVLLDVVYNHFGPDGNYLSEFSSHYFTDRYSCDWGAAINFDGPESEPVREFFVSNAEYWLAEFHLDGLRFDATQAVYDHSPEHVLAEIARRARVAALPRTVFLVAENEAQDSSMARPCESGGKGLDALWNDDFHHAARVALTGFREAYFAGYSGTSQELISAARWGYLYQGQRHSWLKKARGSPALDLPSSAFVDFLENHDQVANSGHGKRLWQVAPPGPYRALTALLLLGPGTPLLFQGQEFASSRPFVYFADHLAPLGPLVSKGRRGFLSQFPSLAGPEAQATLPDPTEPSAFERSKLDPEEMSREKDATRLVRDLLRLRKEDPPFRAQGRQELFGAVLSTSAFALRSVRPDAQRLLLVNLGADLPLTDIAEPMLAPPEGHRWALAWSSEHPSYGGKGLAPLYVEENLHLPGGCAILLRPEAVREKESGPRGGGSGAGP
jgi:maltooligosyltrehalose trehalohydrolase